jgi:uncharacterized membrane protein YoaK (UPF0700 family)
LVSARIVAPTRGSGVWPARVTVALGAVVAAQVAVTAVWVAVSGDPSDDAAYVLIAVLALAMGMQTYAVFSLGVRAVFTTAATATFAVLMGDLTAWSSTRDERRRLTAVIAGLIAGAAAGAVLVVHARVWAPVLPLVISSLVVAVAAFALRARELPVPAERPAPTDLPAPTELPLRTAPRPAAHDPRTASSNGG